MSTPIHDKNQQLQYIKQRLHLLSTMVDNIDPEEGSESEMKRLEEMVEQLRIKCRQFQPDWKDD